MKAWELGLLAGAAYLLYKQLGKSGIDYGAMDGGGGYSLGGDLGNAGGAVNSTNPANSTITTAEAIAAGFPGAGAAHALGNLPISETLRFTPNAHAGEDTAALQQFISANANQMSPLQLKAMNDLTFQMSQAANKAAILENAKSILASPGLQYRDVRNFAPAGTSVGGNLISTGAGYYNPYTGVTHYALRF